MEQSCPHLAPPLGKHYLPLSDEHLEHPDAFYAIARREEPVFFSDTHRMWIVTRYDDVRTVLSDTNLFSSKDSITPIGLCPKALEILGKGVAPVLTVINTDPPGHNRFCLVIDRALSGMRVHALEPVIGRITQSLLEALALQKTADVISGLASPLPLRVMAHLCDIDDRHIDQLALWQQDMFTLMSPLVSAAQQIDAAAGVVAYQEFLSKHITTKVARPGDDITSALLEGGGGDAFCKAELVNQMAGLFVAGHATVTHLIGNTLHRLLSDPTRWAKLLEQDIPAVIEEVLRIEPPISAFLRTATADTTLGGVDIAAADNVLVSFGSANRDEHQFPRPERFELRRNNALTHLGFGWGTHVCSGSSLARLESRIALQALLQRWPKLRLAPDQHLHWLPSLMFRALERLEIGWS